MKYTVIVNCNLEYEFDVDSVEEARRKAEDITLPEEYVDGSFDIVKVIDEEGDEF